MPGHHPRLARQQIPTVLGLLEVRMPVGAGFAADPGAAEGSAWFWLAQPGSAVVTISEGDAATRTPEALLSLERSLGDLRVEVIRDEVGSADDEREVEFCSIPAALRTFRTNGAEVGSHTSDSDPPSQRARFRFWQRGEQAVRIGYRIDTSVEATWRTVLDEVVESARLS